MYTVELYARVRRAVHVGGRSQREVAREFVLSRKTVRKTLSIRRRPGISGRSRSGARSWDRARLPSTSYWTRAKVGYEGSGTPQLHGSYFNVLELGDLNRHLEAECVKRRQRRLRGHRETIAERFERDRAALLPLPAAPYEACEKITTRVTSLSLVRYRSNDYSVPAEYGHRQVLAKGYVHQVVIVWGNDVIARHPLVD